MHKDLTAFKGSLFDTNETKSSKLNSYVGKRYRFKEVNCPMKEGVFTVECVQKIFDGTLEFRVIGDKDIHKWGFPAHPDELVPLLKVFKGGERWS